MTDRSESPTPVTHRVAPDGGDPAPQFESVTDRLRVLEQQIAALQDSARLEQLVTERVMARVQSHATPPPEGYAALNGVSAAPAGAGPSKAFTALAGYVPAFAAGAAANAWSRLSVLRELRLIFGMYVDARYRVSRVTQLAMPGLLLLMVANYFFFNWFTIGIVVVTPVLERCVLIVLAVALYKVLSREANRYASVLQYLSQYSR